MSSNSSRGRGSAYPSSSSSSSSSKSFAVLASTAPVHYVTDGYAAVEPDSAVDRDQPAYASSSSSSSSYAANPSAYASSSAYTPVVSSSSYSQSAYAAPASSPISPSASSSSSSAYSAFGTPARPAVNNTQSNYSIQREKERVQERDHAISAYERRDEDEDEEHDEKPATSSSSSSRHRRCGCSLPLYNILILSFSLMLVFSSFNTLQSWLTSLLPSLGYPSLANQSLAVLYVAVCVFLVFTPALVKALGHIRAIIAGAACYLLYLGSFIKVVTPAVLVCSGINGAGASLLWVAIGAFLAKCSSRDARGFYTGIFWSIFQCSGILGNIFAFFIFNQGSASPADKKSTNSTLLFICFTVVAAVGWAMLFLLRELPDEDEAIGEEVAADERQQSLLGNGDSNGSAYASDTTSAYGASSASTTALSSSSYSSPPAASSASSIIALLRTVVRICTSRTLLFLIPAFLFQGIEFSFWNGELGGFFDSSLLGMVLVWAAVGEAIGGLSMGWLSDRIGRAMTWLLGSFTFCVALLTLYAVKINLTEVTAKSVTINTSSDGSFSVPLIAFLSSFCFGLTDAIVNTQIYAVLGDKFKKHSKAAEEDSIVSDSSASATAAATKRQSEEEDIHVVAAFTIFNFFQNIAASIGFLYQPYFPAPSSNIQFYVNAWAMLIAAFGFIACDFDYFTDSGVDAAANSITSAGVDVSSIKLAPAEEEEEEEVDKEELDRRAREKLAERIQQRKREIAESWKSSIAVGSTI